MIMMDGDPVRDALDASLRILAPHAEDHDWNAPAGPVEWSCRDTAAHIAHDLLAYAGQLAARPRDRYLPFDLTVRPEAGPAQVLAVVTAAGQLLATTLDVAPSDLRAYHHGPCGPQGFAAMGVAELLLHTHDITLGLGLTWQPPEELCAYALHRLFPDAPREEASARPGATLLWCTGRGELNGRPRRSTWNWRAATGEWDD
ncbi:maleylpyruvate isomerase N-terminal domain-containing protein [Streptomyces sp. NRRL S-350]|uniref:maleylpyruvate isomerase N-terminal domain-containing protein n=1 Tax=Streptomyces sp. NRRL S-350 TaxID=1463902 RepID=UPI000ACCDAD8|nr:maleylpyruvate isomerase N-terminal domain-containing protein [Streptomyces sp. NRRL S-350]